MGLGFPEPAARSSATVARRGCEDRINDISGVAGRSGLEQKHVRLDVRNRAVLDASGHHDEFARPDVDRPVAELNPEATANSKKELVFVFVVVPHEHTLKFCQFHFLTIERSDNFRSPVLGDPEQFIVQGDFVHALTPKWAVLLRS
jgi:hypothetical protein